MIRTIAKFTIAILMGVSAEAQNTVVQNDAQFDNWLQNARAALANAAGKAKIKPGERFSMSLEVCIDNEVANIVFFITGGQGGSVYVDKDSVTDSGSECNSSTDLSGGDLSSPNAIKAIQNTVSELLGSRLRAMHSGTPEMTPRSVPSTNFALVPPYRNALFIPVYQPPLDFSSSLSCNPSNGATVVQVHHDSGSVSINGGCTGALITTIPVVAAPLQVDITPDASLALVTSFNNAVNFIDLTTNTVADTLQTTPDMFPSGIAISPDGTTAYVTSFTSAEFQGTPELLAIDIAQRSIVGKLPTADFPQSVFVTPDGSQAWVTHPFSNVIEVVDTLTYTTSSQLGVMNPFSMVFDSTGTRAFITSQGGNVVVIDTATYALLASIPVGAGPVDITLTPEDGLLIVNNYVGQSMTLIDPSSYAVLGTFPLPGPPRGLAIVQ